MSRERDFPPPLRAAGGTELERRLLTAVAREQPPRRLSERMASAIGVAPPAPGGAADGAADPVAPATGTGGAAAQLTSAGGSFLPWISAAAVTAALGGVLVATRPEPAPPPARAAAPTSSLEFRTTTTPGAARAPAPTASVGAPSPAPVQAPRPRAAAAASASDLKQQILLLDAARGALAAGAPDRALQDVQHYLGKYPAGSFRPEAMALKIEALVQLGRKAEARTLAERFVAEQRSGPLTDRVKGWAGLR